MNGRALERAFSRALASIDLEARTRAAVLRAVPSRTSVRVIAVGKASPAMARGALAALGPRVIEALVVAPDGVDADVEAKVLRARHPLPDARSVRAAERALAVARACSRDGSVLLALVSGGASSLLCAPYRATLGAKVATIRALLLSRAPVTEINCVRRHASRVKGGALLVAARPARVVTLLVSDVIGGAIYDIGSGPTLADPTSREDARAILERYGAPLLPLRGSVALPRSSDARRSNARVIASPRDLARATRAELDALGLRARMLAPRTGDVAAFARSYAEHARTLAPGEAIVRAAEPTVAVDAARPGRGGRCGHLSALLAEALPPGVVFMAVASDGVDGASGAAGAIVDRASFQRLRARDVAEAIARFDTASLHARARTTIRGAPSGHNLADVHVLAREPTARSRSRASP